MRILDKYVTKEFIYALLGSIATFALLYIIVDVFGNLEDVIKNQVSLNILVNYYLSLLPIIFVQISPIAILLSTLYTVGKLSHHNEIIAMRSSGLSITQIISPIIIIGIVISCFILLINEKLLPYSAKFSEDLKDEEIRKGKENSSGEEIINNIAVFSEDNRLIFIRKFMKQSKTIEDITILEQDRQQNITAKIIANNGKWLEGTNWQLSQTIIYSFDILGNMANEPLFKDEHIIDLKETPRDLLHKKIKLENMNIKDLSDYIERISQTNSPSVMQSLYVELHRKIAYPFTAFIITLVGIPFGFLSRRRGTAIMSLGICIGISFLYYVANAVGIALGTAGILYPIISAWIAHIIFASIGLILISRLP